MKMKVCLRTIISTLLFLSFFLNCYLVGKTLTYYKKYNLLRIDPLETSFTGEEKKYAEVKKRGPLIVLFGDSRIANWNPETVIPNCTVINKGIRAQTTAQLKLRLSKDVLPYKPDIVVIQAGINDLKTIGLFKKKARKIIRNCKENISFIAQGLANENIEVVILTIFPTGKPGFPRSLFWPSDINLAREAVNTEIKKNKNKKVHVIDADFILRDKIFLHNKFKKNMLHINRRGYKELNEQLEIQLKKVLISKKR